MVHRKDLVQIYQNIPYFKFRNIFLSIKANFLVKNGKKLGFLYAVFFEILPKFSDYVYSDDCIGQINSKSIGLQIVFIQKKI